MYAGKRLGKDTAVVYRPSSGLAADFPTALRQAKGDVPPGFSLVYQPVVRLAGRYAGGSRGLGEVDRAQRNPDSTRDFRGGGRSAGLGDVLDAMVLDMACREVAASRLGPRPPRQHRRDTPGRYRFRRGSAPNFGAVRNHAEPTGLGDHRDRTDRGPSRRSCTDRPAERARCQGRSRRFRCGVQLADIPTRIACANHQARPQSGGRCRARSGCGAVSLGHRIVRCTGPGRDRRGYRVDRAGREGAAAGCRLLQGHLFGRPMPIADVGWSMRYEVPLRRA